MGYSSTPFLFLKKVKKVLTNALLCGIIYERTRCADVAELADALDSGSSGHCARAGSSPVIRS